MLALNPHPPSPSGFLEGDLSALSVVDLTRFFGSGGHQVRVEFFADGTPGELRGELWFDEGDLVACHRGTDRDAAAFLALLELREGSFRVHHEGPPPEPLPAPLSWECLLLENAIERDQARHAEAEGQNGMSSDDFQPAAPLISQLVSGAAGHRQEHQPDDCTSVAMDEMASLLDTICQQEGGGQPLIQLLSLTPE